MIGIVVFVFIILGVVLARSDSKTMRIFGKIMLTVTCIAGDYNIVIPDLWRFQKEEVSDSISRVVCSVVCDDAGIWCPGYL